VRTQDKHLSHGTEAALNRIRSSRIDEYAINRQLPSLAKKYFFRLTSQRSNENAETCLS
jgi:hypothetical protein